MELRDYQRDILDQLLATEANALVQLETGAGKTPVEAALSQHAEHSILVAHRITLVRQLSEKLAAFRLEHDIVGTEHTRRRCHASHAQHGRSYIVRGHSKRLAVSIDSLNKRVLSRINTQAPWLIIIDEAHHVLPGNKWGKLRRLFPNARIVGFTATPARMDGESLHVSNGGLFEELIQARGLENNGVRDLIERGYLADFVAYAAPKLKPETLNGTVAFDENDRPYLIEDFQSTDKQRPERPTIPVGLDYRAGTIWLNADPVKEYRRRADGTKAIVMAPAIKNAELFAKEFVTAGIPAAAIHSTMTASRVARILDDFARDKVRVICNVDMIGEGFDMPNVHTLIIATKTRSFPRYRQWVGRVLRPSPGKQRAILIDLTRMIQAHGLPDEPVVWDLLNPPVGKCPLMLPCDECGVYYKVRLHHCPECGAENAYLMKGKSLGNYEFDVEVLDRQLVEMERKAISEERLRERRCTEIIWPDYNRDPGGMIGKTIDALRKWLVETVRKAKVEVETINAFLESEQATDYRWWMQHFTATDMKNGVGSKARTEKALKIFRQWHTQSR